MSKKITYLSEDPIIPSQRYALITIVGPHLRQKCDIWGMKIKGVVDSLEAAKEMSKRLMKFDDNYDIYTVDIGKFFPLNVSPDQLKNVEYQNEQLNNMMKDYLQNKEKANEMWEQRKNEMTKEAIREGTKEGQKELEEKSREFQAIYDYQKMTQLEKELAEFKLSFENYTEQEKEKARTTPIVTGIETEATSSSH